MANLLFQKMISRALATRTLCKLSVTVFFAEGRFGLRLRLRISRRYDLKNDLAEKRFSVVVVDLDKAKTYPLNYVCIFPTGFESSPKRSPYFMRMFGEKSLKLAKRLLFHALRAESDPDFRKEFERRIKLFDRW